MENIQLNVCLFRRGVEDRNHIFAAVPGHMPFLASEIGSSLKLPKKQQQSSLLFIKTKVW